MAGNKQLGITFSVAGGGSVAGESGKLILSQLQSIVSQIEAKGTTQLKFSIDTKSVESSSNSVKNALKGQQSDIAANNREWKSLEAEYKRVNNFDWNNLKNQLRLQQAEVKANNAEWKALGAQQKNNNNYDWSKNKEALAAERAEIAKNNAEWKVLQGSLANKSQTQGVSNSFASATDSVSSFSKTTQDVSGLKAEYAKLIILKNEFDQSPTKTNLDAYNAQKAALDRVSTSLNASVKGQEALTSNSVRFKDTLNNLRNYTDKYSSGLQKNTELMGRFKTLESQLSSGTFEGSAMEARNAMLGLEKEARESGNQIQTLKQKLQDLFGAHLSTAVALVGVHLIQQALSQMYQNVVQLDAALVNLQVATGYTRAETKELLNTYSQMAKELGSTTVEVANASDTWLRQGYSIEQSNILIKDSMMLSKLGQMDSAQATTALTSAMRGYQMSVEDVTSIVDRMTKVDMSAAVSSSYIATAMSETATSANLAGVSMDKLIGYIAAVGSTTQDSAEAVGNSFKTMFARMGNVKMGLLEDPETGESLSNVESALSGVGIKLRDSESEFRNFGDVLDEVAGKWDSYSSVEKRTLAVSFAGGRAPEQQ